MNDKIKDQIIEAFAEKIERQKKEIIDLTSQIKTAQDMHTRALEEIGRLEGERELNRLGIGKK